MFSEVVFLTVGAVLAAFAGYDFGRSRLGNGAFWLLLGVLFAFGPYLPHHVSGMLVLALVVLDGLGLVKHQPPAAKPVERLPGWPILIPVAALPLVTLLAALLARYYHWPAGPTAVAGLGVGSFVAAGAAFAVTRAHPREMLIGGHTLNETLGTVSILPQLLASLGAVFTLAVVGPWLAGLVQAVVPAGHVLGMVLANCLGMVALAALTGNSFAAFPIIASGITVPLLIGKLGGNPELCALLTLTVGASGTLMTPMAANFNLVPGALLEMRHPSRVIRFQVPLALGMLVFQVLILAMLL